MKGYRLSQQPVLCGKREAVGFGTTEYYVQEIERDVANDIIIKNHYSGKFYNASYIHLGVFANGEIKGVLQFGYAMNPTSMASVVANTKKDEYLEPNRMWLHDDLPRNSESMALSYSIKYIRRKYPKIKWVTSFADERCGGLGVVYQASGYKFFGYHSATFWEIQNDDGSVETFHNSLMTRNPKLTPAAAYIQKHKDEAERIELRQFRYIRFLDKRCEKDCLLEEKPYPKRRGHRGNVTVRNVATAARFTGVGT